MMPKKRLLICIALLAALLTVSLIVSQAADVGDLVFTPNSSGNGYIISDCDPTASGALVIPDTHEGKPVVAIGSEAFMDCTNLTAVTIPGSVTSIGWYAFSGCTGLTDITIPDNVTTIDWFAFGDCTALTKVTIGSGVAVIDAGTFSGCSSLTNVTIGTNVKEIGWSAFKNCTKLSSITIPSGVSTIDRYAFTGCTALATVAIPNSVTGIGDGAFYGCSKLSTVIFCGTQNEWNAVSKGNSNTPLTGATLQLHKYVNGSCVICQPAEFIYGDSNGDRSIDGRDVITLCNYLANYDYDTETSTVEITQGADANGDSFVDGRDVIIICNYLANFDYDTGSSTIILGPQN